MHVEGSACWVQSIERRIRSMGWDRFYTLLHDHFGRDQHESFIRQLFHIRQSGSVTEYVDQFSTLVDQLAAYEPNANPLHYATRFVDGPRDNIKLVVMIQQPSTLDTSCALALVWEEAMESGKKKEFRRYEPFSSRAVHRSAYPLLAPPKTDKLSVAAKAEDTGNTEAARASRVDDKVKALKQYRRARGMCNRCAKKWAPQHKCADPMQLHAIQEIWELFSDDEDQVETSSEQTP
jgi:hypothetical protein